jgi:D-alanyl-D-alanine carboxypeptidase/D-alanyl-D-alanine-endopeptidase (penicillin-binding protein 4)
MNLENIIKQYPNAGIFVRDKYGREIFEQNASKTFSPASGIKLFTTACLLDFFDENHTFDTELRCTGEVKDGVLHGDLIIRGDWDPSLGSTRFDEDGITNLFDEFLKAIYKFGIQRIDGYVVCERGQNTKTFINKSWLKDDIPNYYAAGTAALSFNENSFTAYFTSEHQGSFTKLNRIYPKIPIKIENEVHAGEPDSKDNALFKNRLRSMKYKVSGTIPAYSDNFAVKGALFRPSQVMTKLFYRYLKKKKVIVPPVKKHKEINTTGLIEEYSELIYTHKSATIDKLLKTMNQHSINLYAENLARATIKEENNLLLKKSTFFQKCFSNINLENSNSIFDDFCGLSPKNRISPSFMVDFLQAVCNSKLRERFLATLYDYGQTGIRAKTGTMAGVKTFSGVSLEKELFFSIMINDINPLSTKALLEELAKSGHK